MNPEQVWVLCYYFKGQSSTEKDFLSNRKIPHRHASELKPIGFCSWCWQANSTELGIYNLDVGLPSVYRECVLLIVKAALVL